MTAKKVAEWALENGQTMSLCGNDAGATIVMIAALGAIARVNNQITDTQLDRLDEITLRAAKWRSRK